MARNAPQDAPQQETVNADPTVPPEGFEPGTALQAAAEELFTIAADMRADKYEVLGRIDANRQSLRQLAAQGVLADNQVERLAQLYPVKRRREAGEE